jgi:FkbM family methyltransferase
LLADKEAQEESRASVTAVRSPSKRPLWLSWAFHVRKALLWVHLGYLRLNHFFSAISRRPRYYAEFSSDRFLREKFFPDFSYHGTLVEVGCATPRLLSFSQHFRENGWRCIGIEPNPQFAELHRQAGNEIYQAAAADFEADDVPFKIVEECSNYSNSALSAHSFSALSIREDFARYRGGYVNTLNHREIFVAVRKLDTLLADARPSVASVDVVCIDVEGYELDVMAGFSPDRFGTKVVVLENLFHKPEYEKYMQDRGFELVHKMSYNYFFARRDANFCSKDG